MFETEITTHEKGQQDSVNVEIEAEIKDSQSGETVGTATKVGELYKVNIIEAEVSSMRLSFFSFSFYSNKSYTEYSFNMNKLK